MKGSLVSWVFLILASVNSTLGNLLLKKSQLDAVEGSAWQVLLSPWFFAGLVCYGVNVVLFVLALRTLPVSIAYPVLAATGFGFLAVAAYFLFSEHLGVLQIAGLAMIVGGILLVAQGVPQG